MKKIFGIFVCVMCMPGVSTCALGGQPCTYQSKTLPDRGTEDNLSCGIFNIQHGEKCFVYCDDGTIRQGVHKCADGYFKLNPVTGVDGMFEMCGSLQQACESYDSKKTGAWWDNITNECRCNGGSMSWNKHTMQCDKSDDFAKCENDKDAVWDYEGGFCWCKDSNKLWFNGQCRDRIEKKACDEIIGKLKETPYAGSIQWNTSAQRCECVADKIAADGEKIENPDDYFIGYVYKNKNGDKVDAYVCYLKPSVQYKRDTDAFLNSDRARQMRDNIKNSYNKLGTISGAWGKSRWKTASGNFNGARLASDSVAGVVLGTVGGVITSNVVKKNQVRGGFEDINCTIGGQRVADFDDQFSVGIQ